MVLVVVAFGLMAVGYVTMSRYLDRKEREQEETDDE